MALSVPTNTVHLRLVQPAPVDPAHAAALFGRPDAEWLGTLVEPARPGTRRYLTDLSLPVRDRSPHTLFRKAAFVDVGEVRTSDGGCEVEIGWRSSSLAPLFPVFAGHLSVEASTVTLEGYYAPPGGDVGLVLDRAFLNIAARGTARWFLGRVIETLTSISGDVVSGDVAAGDVSAG